MTARRLWMVLPVAAAVLAGCGQSAGQRTPELSKLPLVAGSQPALKVVRCDKGADAFCGWELLVVAPRYASSEQLVKAERRLLLKAGWTGGVADTGEEHAADSPGHKLRVTYATASQDLQDIDLGRVKRSRKLTLALSRAMFGHAAAMSMLLEVGAS